ncbi:MAG: hypothetical protein K2Y42_15545 [Hyphomicrobium sp.]|jgi:hypothetical protein|uniref:hypothetical protein n=1 Tax=Hyphomicrobium sp. TaxID=82 RepID=UPI0025BF3125|nr:hypothetical protein [Hyphomicrobium sp.]MBX9864153.1 hypothetical protein [Hyphomicrobium sp.]
MGEEAKKELASVLFANGEGFLPYGLAGDSRDEGEICYATAIACELVLKAYLLSQGWNDDRCRREIRHDLATGLVRAQEAGLTETPNGLGYVIGVLNSYYPEHAFDRFTAPAGDATFPLRARSIISQVFELVRPYVEDPAGR